MSKARLVGFVVLLVVSPAGTTRATERPNFLIIIADDCTYNDLPIYGGANARTPNIERLASQGLVFNRAYLSMAMCQPCRAELYTGQYPLRNGCAWNHSASRPTTTSMPMHLGRYGYRVGLAGKVHVGPPEAFPFEKVHGFDPNGVRNPTREHDTKGVCDFIARQQGQPFCLVVALVEPHVPWVQGDGSLNNPYWATWVGEAWNNPHTYQLVKRYVRRPREQLYNTANDPYELTDIADDPTYARLKARLRGELDRWMKAQGDPGAAQDTHRAIQAARRGKHLHGPPH